MESTARKFIKVSWWIQTIEIVLICILAFMGWSLSLFNSIGSGSGILEFTSILVIFGIMAVIGQLISWIGIKEIPNSKGWAIYYIIWGIVLSGGIIGILYIVGGVLSLMEHSRQEEC